ncbi:MAG TPA: hypothetical protein VEU51_16265 [Candidatus Acidoferrales bacterium]|nr:hypothetical protein [Candidatus Acidoferrales bacterium]
MKSLVRSCAIRAVWGALALSIAACNSGLGGFSGSVGNTPKGPAQTSFRVLGTTGTPFTATVSNSRSSWTLQGAVPLSIEIINNVQPARIIATKTVGDGSLLSVQVINGSNLLAVASTTAPFGTVQVQTRKKFDTIAPAAVPDLRIFVMGPAGERFSALIEDLSQGFSVDSRAPTLFLIDTPNGKVTGQFFQIQNLGPFDINMTLEGIVVATAKGAPTVVIQEP